MSCSHNPIFIDTNLISDHSRDTSIPLGIDYTVDDLNPLYRLLNPRPFLRQVALTPPSLARDIVSSNEDSRQEVFGSIWMSEHIHLRRLNRMQCNQNQNHRQEAEIDNPESASSSNPRQHPPTMGTSRRYGHLICVLNEALEISESILNSNVSDKEALSSNASINEIALESQHMELRHQDIIHRHRRRETCGVVGIKQSRFPGNGGQ